MPTARHGDARRLPTRELLALRRRAVLFVLRGASVRNIAERLGLRAATLAAWVQRYRDSGRVGLRPHRRGRRPLVDADAIGSLLQRMLSRPPSPGKAWSIVAVVAALAHVGMRLSRRVVARLLIVCDILPAVLVRPQNPGTWRIARHRGQSGATIFAVDRRGHCRFLCCASRMFVSDAATLLRSLCAGVRQIEFAPDMDRPAFRRVVAVVLPSQQARAASAKA